MLSQILVSSEGNCFAIFAFFRVDDLLQHLENCFLKALLAVIFGVFCLFTSSPPEGEKPGQRRSRVKMFVGRDSFFVLLDRFQDVCSPPEFEDLMSVPIV